MKSMTRILSLALAAILALSLCAVGAFADDAPPSAEPEGETTRSATPAPEAGTPTPAETAAPTATPAPTPTAAPLPVPTAAPAETPTPTEAPEIGPPTEDGPSIDEPCGDGIVMGPNNPPEDGPMMFAANSNSATIAVRSCYDSSNNSIKYANSFQYDGRWVGGATYPRHIIYANGSPAYCLEPGKYLVGGSNVTTDAAKIWAGYSTTKKDAIKLAILCGAEGNASNLSGSYGSQYTATQMIVWEFVVGVRSTSSPYSVSDNKVINSVCYNGANSEVKTVYDQISAAMVAYNTLPSFANPLAAPPPQNDLQYNNGTYSLTLTDSNNVLGNYNITCTDNNVKLSVNGNKLTMRDIIANKDIAPKKVEPVAPAAPAAPVTPKEPLPPNPTPAMGPAAASVPASPNVPAADKGEDDPFKGKQERPENLKIILTGDRLRKYFPDVEMTPREVEESIYGALEERRQRQIRQQKKDEIFKGPHKVPSR